MLHHNFPVNPWLTKLRRFTIMTQHVVIKPLGLSAIFFPPSPNRTHVMSRWRYHSEVWRIIGMKEFFVWIFRHTFYFKTQDTKVLHHFGYAMRYHAEVFSAYQHIGAAFQIG